MSQGESIAPGTGNGVLPVTPRTSLPSALRPNDLTVTPSPPSALVETNLVTPVAYHIRSSSYKGRPASGAEPSDRDPTGHLASRFSTTTPTPSEDPSTTFVQARNLLFESPEEIYAPLQTEMTPFNASRVESRRQPATGMNIAKDGTAPAYLPRRTAHQAPRTQEKHYVDKAIQTDQMDGSVTAAASRKRNAVSASESSRRTRSSNLTAESGPRVREAFKVRCHTHACPVTCIACFHPCCGRPRAIIPGRPAALLYQQSKVRNLRESKIGKAYQRISYGQRKYEVHSPLMFGNDSPLAIDLDGAPSPILFKAERRKQCR